MRNVAFDHNWVMVSLVTIALFGFFGLGFLVTYCPVTISSDSLLMIVAVVAIALCYFLTHYTD